MRFLVFKGVSLCSFVCPFLSCHVMSGGWVGICAVECSFLALSVSVTYTHGQYTHAPEYTHE